MAVTLYHWIAFNLLILVLLGIDLWHSFRHPHRIGMKEALFTSFFWILLAFFFNGWIYFAFGPQPALEFFTGYLIEKSLSVDNLFIFLMIFAHFKVPDDSKHLVLFYGVLGAILMRALLIWAGIALIENFQWMFYIFGIFLIITGIRFAFQDEKEEKLEENLVYSWLKKWLPFTDQYKNHAFFIKENHRWLATPLFAVLILIETTDLIFALDSVPAILGITTEPFIVYTSNIFAILGLRSLFFALESVMKAFHLLHYALAFILIFIGCKMIAAPFIHIPTFLTLLILFISLLLAIGGSLLYPPQDKKNS